MKTIEMPVCKCLACGTTIDMVSWEGDEIPPAEGDISICFECGHLMSFTSELKVREMTRQEVASALADDRIALIRAARGWMQ